MSQTTNIKVGESAKTITLPEGKSLVITGSAGAAGVAYLLDPALGGTNSLRSWAVGAGALAPIGAYEGTQKVLLTCSAGSIAAVTKEAVLTISATPTPTAPGQPAKPVLTAMSGAVSLAWTPGAAGSTATTGNVWTDINGNTTALTTNPQVITAPAGTPYTGTVKTQNAQGFGLPSVQADAVTPTADDPYMIASNRTMFASGASQVVNGNQYEAPKVVFRSPPYPVPNPRVCFDAFVIAAGASNNEVNLGNPILIERANMVINGGAPIEFTFSGSASYTIPDGGWIWTDPLGDNIIWPANALIEIAVADYVPVGGFRPNRYLQQNTNGSDGLASSTVSVANRLTTRVFGQGRLTSTYGPCAIVGKGWVAAGRPAVPITIPDSIGYGLNDQNIGYAPDGVFGALNRAMNDSTSSTRFAYANFGAPGGRLSNLAAGTGGFGKRDAILKEVNPNWPCTSAIIQLGINTISNATPAQCIADMDAAIAYVNAATGGKPIVLSTYYPQVNGSDANQYTSLASQVPQGASSHVALTNYVKSKPAGVFAVIDIEPLVCESTDKTKWPVTALNCTLVNATTVGQSTFDVTVVSGPAPAVDDFLVIDVGANNDTKKLWAVTGTGPVYTLTIGGTLGRAHAAGAAVKSQYTEDGTHPTTAGAKLAMPAYIAAKNAGLIK